MVANPQKLTPSQDTKAPQVEVFRRTEPGLWLLQAYGSADLLVLERINLSMPITEIYADVDFNR